jgi:N-acetylglucosamine-6-phosphate deacetylase
MRTLIRNARLVSPGWMREGALLFGNGVIFGTDDGAADEIIDAEGRIVMPGFIDIHSHGADGKDVCDGSVESIRHISMKKLQEGVTTWLPTTLTQPEDRLREIAAHCAEAMRNQEFCRMPGIHLEGPFINPEKAGAQNPQFARMPDAREIDALHAIVPLKIISLAPELPGARDVIRAAVGKGIVCSAAHTAATFGEIQAAKLAGLTHLTHFGNAMTPLHHREIGVVGAGLVDDALRIELIADGVHLSEDMLRLVFKCVPIDRILLITDSVAASWRGDGGMKLGGLDAEIREGIVRLKTGELAGSALRFNDGLRKAMKVTGRPLEEIVAATSLNQAKSLGMGGLGKLEPGFSADLVMMNDDFSIHGVWVAGKRKV